MDMLYRHTRAGYSLELVTPGQEPEKRLSRGKGKAPDPSRPSYTRSQFQKLYRQFQHDKEFDRRRSARVAEHHQPPGSSLGNWWASEFRV